MDYKEFIDAYYNNTNQPTKIDVEFFLQQITEIFNRTKELLHNPSDKEIYSTIFEDTNNITTLAYKVKHDTGRQGDISLTKFLRLKKFLANFTDYLNLKGLLSNYEELKVYIMGLTPQKLISEQAMSQLYFKSIKDVISSIDKLGKLVLDNYNPYYDLLDIKAIAILLWRGVKPEIIAKLKVSNISSINDNYIIAYEENERQIIKAITESEYFYLNAYISCDSQRGLPSGRKTFYNPTEYIIKAKKSKVTGSDVIAKLYKYNLSAYKYNHQSLNTTVLMKCGKFEDIHTYSVSHTGLTIRQCIKDLLKCDRRTAYDINNVYMKWLNMFYGKQN